VRRVVRLVPFVGITGIVLALAKLHAKYIGDYDFTESNRFGWTIAYIVTCCLIAYGVGIPDHDDPGDAARASVIASLAAPVAFGLMQLAFGGPLLPRSVIALSAPLFLVLLLVSGAARRRSWGAAALATGVVAILDEHDEREFVADLDGPIERAAELRRVARLEEFAEPGLLGAAITSTGATLLVLGRRALGNAELLTEVAELHGVGLRVRDISGFYDEWIGKVPHRELGQAALMFDIAEIHRPGYARVSRLVDVAVTAVALVPFALATPFVLLGNLIGNRGPLLYRQARVGRDGVEFEMLKFRSMTPGASTGQWTTADDARITMFGKFLRKTHVDELPQVINILRGDLAVVGPRPEQPQYVHLLSEKISFYHLRHLVRPGITGWAQVNYPYGADERDALEKLQFEFWYMRHQCISLDLQIIGRTIRHVFGFKGR
jgi:lipopolysaccharide/colanic/teichoic acid biosynthesis glycosyltransferase